MKWLRRGAIVIGILLAVPLVLAAGVLGAIQFPAVQNWAAGKVQELTAGSDMQIAMSGLSGGLPFSPKVDRLTLSDHDGVWLEVDRAELDVAWTELLTGRIHVRDIQADRVAVHRTPRSTAPEPPPEPFSLPDPAALPRSIPPVLIDRLNVGRIELAQPVLGEPLLLALDGAMTARDDGGQVDTRLDLRRIDQPDLTITLASVVDLAARRLSIDLTGSETGGIVARLAGLPQAGDLKLALQGDGPLNDWHGQLAVDFAHVGSTNADLVLGITDHAMAGIDARIQPAGSILPEGIRPLVGEQVRLAMQADLGADGSLNVEGIDLVTAALGLTGSVRIPANDNGLDGTLVANVRELSRLSGLAGRPLSGAVRATLGLGGTRERPAAQLALVGQNMAMDQLRLADFDSDIALISGSALGQELTSADFKIEATAAGLSVPGTAMPDDAPIRLSASGSANRDGRVQVADLDFAGLGATLAGNADVATDTLLGNAMLDARVPSLGILRPFLPPEWGLIDGQANLDVRFASTEPGAAEANSTLALNIAQIQGLPDQFRDIVGEQVAITADALVHGQRHVTLRSLSATSSAVELHGNGVYDLQEDKLAADLNASAADLGKFADLAGLPLSGRVDMAVNMTGTTTAPAATLDLRTTALGGLPDDLRAVLGETPSVMAAASKADDGTLALSRLDLTTATALVQGSGAYNPADGTIQGDLTGRAEDLSFLARWLGGEPKGKATLTVAASGTAQAPVARMTFNASGLSGFAPSYAEAIGEEVNLDLAGKLAPAAEDRGRQALLEQLELRAGAVSTSGTGSYGLDDGALQANVLADVAQMAKLSGIAGTDLAGTMKLDASVSGSVDHPDVLAQVTGTRVRAAGRSLGQVSAKLDAKDLVAGPNGSLAVSLAPGREPLTLQADFRKDASVVDVRRIELRGPGQLKLDGGMKVGTAPLSATGKLAGGVRNLAALEPFAGQPLTGRLNMTIEADGTSSQSARATLAGTAIGMPGVIQVDGLNLQAALTDLFGTPGIRSNLVADGIRRQDVELTRTTLRADGRVDALSVTFGTQGVATVPVQVDAAAMVRRSGKTISIDLSKLEGKIAGEPLRLRKPAKLEAGGTRTALSDLDLQYGAASLSGSASLAADRVRGSLQLRGLDLASLPEVGAPPLTGRVEADINLAGTGRSPRIDLTTRGRGVAMVGTLGSSVVPLDLDLVVKTTGKQLDSDLALSGLGTSPLRLAASVPMELSLQPFSARLPDDGALAGALTGSVDLARIGRFAALDGQRLQGTMKSDLRLSGTILRPLANGSLDLVDAAFADTNSGASVRDLGLSIRANGQQVRLEQLTGTDGGTGRLSGTGAIDLGRPTLPFQASIRLDDFRPVFRDDLLLRLGGTTDVRGDKESANIVGRFLVDRAEISIPDGGSGGTIPVIEVTDGPGASSDSASAAAGSAYQANLDIVVDMPERIFVRGRGLESEWGGAVQVKGTAEEPIVTGRIAIKRGFLNLLDRRFDLERGIVSLDGAVPPDPELDVRATFEANSLLGILQVTGRASDPKLELTSDPVRPQDEIMAEILFGRDVSKITAVQGLQLAAALNTLRGGGGGGIMETFRQNLGVDTLDFGGNNADDASVKAGKYISDDVFLQVERGVAPGSGKATVEVELVPNVTVQTEVTEDSQTGFGLQWKYDY